MTLSRETVAEIETLRGRYPQARSAVLPSLWAVQHEVGYVSADGMKEVARLLDLTPSEVQAVSTFYSMYFHKPEGKHSVIVCRNVSCGLRGSDEIAEYIGKKLGCESGQTSADGEFTWESTVECLGACDGAPAMQVDHRSYADLTAERVDEIFARISGQRSEATPQPGSTKKKSGRRPKLAPEDL
jgi:NADH-quinone oxidoreductase subunit E